MPAAWIPRPSRPMFAALVAAVIGVTLVALSGPPAAAQAQAAKAEIDGTAQSKWEPANVTIKPGGSVTFKVSGGPPHPVQSGDGSNPAGDGKFDAKACAMDKMGAVGASCTVTFPKAGTYPYFCVVHVSLGMKGVVQVGAGGGATTTTAGGGSGGTQQVIPPPEAGGPAQPGKPVVFWAGYGLLGLGALLFLAALAGYIRYSPSFRRESRGR